MSRGGDHINQRALKLPIFRHLVSTRQAFWHHNLLTGFGRRGVIKTACSLSLEGLRVSWFVSHGVALIGQFDRDVYAVEPIAEMAGRLRKMFDHQVSKSPARFDVAELMGLNAKMAPPLPYKQFLIDCQCRRAVDGALFWDAVQGQFGEIGRCSRWGANCCVRCRSFDLMMRTAKWYGQATSSAAPRSRGLTEPGWMANAVKARHGGKAKGLFSCPCAKACYDHAVRAGMSTSALMAAG